MNSKPVPLSPTASLGYQPQFIRPENSSALLKKLIDEVSWEQSEITLFGRKHSIPRLNAWYGDKAYTYSGTRFEATAWTTELTQLKTHVEKTSGLEFNSVLINWYRDGQDSMGWHSDDEKSLGNAPQIASVSLGESRRFMLRKKTDHTNKKELTLEDGSLLLMLGETQKLWQHSLPKTKKPKGDRINLTFRLIRNSE